MEKIKKRPVGFILLFYLLCFLLRGIEYILVRTDQSVIGEAFIHKIIGIALLAVAVATLKYKWSEIGFAAGKALKGLSLGLLFGAVVLAIAYGAEIVIQSASGNAPSLRFYVTSYAIQGNRAMQDGVLFVVICIVGNVINVIMEEGVFRGLFIRLGEKKLSFMKAGVLSAVLFGVWHIAQPVRNVIDGVQSPMGAVMMGLMLVVTSALLAIQYALLFKMTGTLWIGMAAHFMNNAAINLLHVVTETGVDEMQVIRISIAQSLSFIIVLIMFICKTKRRQ